MNYWIIFSLCGLFAIPCVILCFAFGDTTKGKITSTIVCVTIWAVVAGAMWCQDIANDGKWNDGYCECGQHWELKGVTRTKMGSETKYYACPNCYKEIEINH